MKKNNETKNELSRIENTGVDSFSQVDDLFDEEHVLSETRENETVYEESRLIEEESTEEEAVQEDIPEPKKKSKRKGRMIRRIIMVAVEFLLLSALVFVLIMVSTYDGMQIDKPSNFTKDNGETIEINNIDQMESEYVEKIQETYKNFAVFGVDALGYNTDVIMIVSLNMTTGEAKMVSVYRDMVVYMPDSGSYDKVNSAAARYGFDNGVATLNQNLDLMLTDYVRVDWTTVINAINLLGGVEVDVTDAMLPYLNGYLTEVVNTTGIGSTQLTSSGRQLLDGPQAVAYCRIRYVDSDYGRTARQREVVQQMVSKAKTAGPDKLMKIADLIFKECKTTLELGEIFEMCSIIDKISLDETTGFPFYKTDVTYCGGLPNVIDPSLVMGLEVNVSQLHKFLYDKESYVPSPRVHQISTDLEMLTGITAPETTTDFGNGG